MEYGGYIISYMVDITAAAKKEKKTRERGRACFHGGKCESPPTGSFKDRNSLTKEEEEEFERSKKENKRKQQGTDLKQVVIIIVFFKNSYSPTTPRNVAGSKFIGVNYVI
ncbi:hypothetical protein J1N35_015982 [Gossypium stocksii]|uniref:Uncharacterized protein n=1 Tax=Gossypium stocksii TaxID=47602 RepID=A0A9D3VZF5_9ROSI|nr:hypothetical protein J1N35_015982 [Gossypium stocksii]